jgi:hypothetical protein
MKTTLQTIELHRDAPTKPALGERCNGCGVCCAAEPCPIAWVFLWQRKGSCRALEWHSESTRYVCGMVTNPTRHVRWLPTKLDAPLARFCANRIAAGIGCDSHAVVESADQT